LGRLLLFATLENFGYRQRTVWWRVQAFWSVFRQKQAWGEMTRKGFESAGKQAIEPATTRRADAQGEQEGVHRCASLCTGSYYLTVMLPAVSVAVGNATALRINPRLPAEAVTVKGTPGRGRVPSPMSTVAVPLKVALPSAPTDPPLTSPSTVMFC